MSSSSYPTSLPTYTTRTDYVDPNAAADINKLATDLSAIAATLGVNAGTAISAAQAPTAATVANELYQLQVGKSPTSHSHTQLPAVTIGGATTGQYLSISGDTIQAFNNGLPTALVLQPRAGNVSIGPGLGAALTVYGSIDVESDGAITAKSLSVTTINAQTSAVSNGTITTLTSTNATVNNNITVGNNLTFQTQGGSVVFYNGETIQDLQEGNVYQIPGLKTITQYGNAPESTLHSRFAIQGQLWVHKNRTGTTNDWTQSPALSGRTDGSSDSSIAWAALNGEGAGYAWYIQTDASQANLGFQHRNGSTVFCPVSASSFVTSSSITAKQDVQDLDSGLETVLRLRPVSFTRDNTGHAVEMTPEGFSRPRGAGKGSAGDYRKNSQRQHGLIAEEVVSILPEVVHYDAKGAPAGIDYGAINGVLIKAIHQMKARSDEDRAHIAELRDEIDRLKALVGTP